VPRRINLLCDRALLGAYAAGQLRVEPSVVDKAAGEVFDDTPPVRNAPRKAAQGGPGPATWGTLGLGAVAGAVVGAAVAAAMTWFWLQRSAPLPVPGAAAPATPVTASTASTAPTESAAPAEPTAAAAAAAAPAPIAARPEIELPLGWPTADALIDGEALAWRALAPLWRVELAAGEPCTQALAQGLQCYRTERMTINGLRQLNRPGVLQVRLSDGSSGRLLLTALGEDSAVLGHGAKRWRVALAELSHAVAPAPRADHPPERRAQRACGRVAERAPDGAASTGQPANRRHHTGSAPAKLPAFARHRIWRPGRAHHLHAGQPGQRCGRAPPAAPFLSARDVLHP
jgi:general secretion pathway protein A